MDSSLLFAVIAGIVLLFALILYLKLPAFISLLISSIAVGLLSGMEVESLLESMKVGMGSTLGFVAVVVGLGAMLGAILEHSGGALALSKSILNRFGEGRASWALMFIGFIIAIPVFFDVAFIIMVPMLYALQRKSGRSLLLYAIPLLASLIIAHAFIPPTPGPIAVADILNADLGNIILLGVLVGLPTAILCGPILGKYMASKIHLDAPAIQSSQLEEGESETKLDLPKAWQIALIIFIPIALIVSKTLLNQWPAYAENSDGIIQKIMNLIGHPFVALILANLIAWYVLGRLRGFTTKKLLSLSNKSLETAGIIILLTGAGGVFKQILVDTGAGKMLAELVAEANWSILIVAFLTAAIVRILQGSATVAMITAAGLIAPLIGDGLSTWHLSLVVLAIASGASTTSHVNDSSFWLVSQYLGMAWTLTSTLISIVSICLIMVLSLFI